MSPSREARQSTWDLWYGRAVRTLGVLLGSGMTIWETLKDKADHPWVYPAAIAFMGLPAAQAAETLIRKVASGAHDTTGLPEPAERE